MHFIWVTIWTLAMTTEYDRQCVESIISTSILVTPIVFFLLLPHLALSWNFSLTENLANLSLQDWATKWYYFPTGSPTRPPDQVDLYIEITKDPLVKLRRTNQNKRLWGFRSKLWYSQFWGQSARFWRFLDTLAGFLGQLFTLLMME